MNLVILGSVASNPPVKIMMSILSIKPKTIFLSFGLLFSTYFLQGQDKSKELAAKFYAAETDSSKLKTIEALFMYNVVRDLSKTEALTHVLDSLCTKIHLSSCTATKALLKGFYHRKIGNYADAITHLEQARSAFEALGNENKQAVCLFNMGVVTSYRGDYEGAVRFYLEARDLYGKVDNVSGVINVNNSLGIIYKNIKEYEKSKETYLIAAEAARVTNNKDMQAMIYNNVANLFAQQENYTDSTITYGKKALDLEQELERFSGIASAHNLIGSAYVVKMDEGSAFFHTRKALEYSEKSGVPRLLVVNLLGLADTYAKFEKYEKSFQMYELGLRKADSLGLLRHQVAGYENYANALSKNGRFRKAYYIQKKFETLNDSLNVAQSRTDIAVLEKKYAIAIKDQEIKNQEIEINKKTYQRNLLSGGLLLSLLLGSSLIWGIFSRSRRKRQISMQEKNLQLQKIQSLEQEKKLLSMSSLLEGQESERIRIAKDLHDGLGGLLTTVKAHFGKIQSEIEDLENIDTYNSTNLMIDKAYDEVRRISHNLMPADLRVGGLPVAIRQLVHELKNVHEIKTDFELLGFTDARVDEKIELSIYRITQELINNTLKYADASEIFIQLSKFQEEVQVTVEDNGKGFDYNVELASKGLGLKSILSRVEQIKGTMDVDTSVGNGTSVTINIPI